MAFGLERLEIPREKVAMTKAVRVHKVGGPEALIYEDVDVAAPGPGEVRIRQIGRASCRERVCLAV